MGPVFLVSMVMIMPGWLVTVDFQAAGYDIVAADKNWVTVVTGGIGAGL
jgi:hypothetical protein